MQSLANTDGSSCQSLTPYKLEWGLGLITGTQPVSDSQQAIVHVFGHGDVTVWIIIV